MPKKKIMIDLNLKEIKDLIAQAKKDKVMWGIKFTQTNGCCFSCKEGYASVKYVVGKYSEVVNPDTSDKECSSGIHLGKSFIGAGNYNLPEKIFFCTFKKADLYGQGDDKWRVSKTLVVKELPQWLGCGPNGQKIVAKIGKKLTKTQLTKYNPYQATKLPTLAQVMEQVGYQLEYQVRDQIWYQVREQVREQVGAQVKDQVGEQVGGRVKDQVWDQIWYQVKDQVRDQVGAQVEDQVGEQVGAQVKDQVWDQIWATSYWAINVHFNLGVSHWFGDFLKLGVMVIFVQGKVKIFGKKGKYLGEYDQSEVFKK